MKNLLTFFLISTLICSTNFQKVTSEVALGLPDDCNDPDADISCCFVNMPAKLSETMMIGKINEPGERLTITGTLYREDGKTPYPGITMYAYQTDAKGYYSKDGNEKGIQKWHGRLHGWCRTDKNGRYEIRTIRPAPYPDGRIPAHIHAAIKEPGNDKPYYITDFVFKDDKFITSAYASSIRGVGGSGILNLRRTDNGWIGKRDIILKR